MTIAPRMTEEGSCPTCGQQVMFGRQIDIPQAPAAPGQWVACAERMPPGTDDVWLWVPSMRRALMGRWREGQWWTHRTRTDPEVFSLGAITHWMPPPAAPKEATT